MISLGNTKKFEVVMRSFRIFLVRLNTNMHSVFSHHPPVFCNIGFNFLQKCAYLLYCGYCVMALEALLLHRLFLSYVFVRKLFFFG